MRTICLTDRLVRAFSTAGLMALVVAVGVSPATAQVVQSKLVPADGTPDQEFGWRVSLTSDWVFVAAKDDDDVHAHSGAVYVHERLGEQWAFFGKLKAPTPMFSDQFGQALASSGDWMVATAWLSDPQSATNDGSAHVFRLQGGAWLHSQELIASDFASSSTTMFGESAAMDGSVLLIGMPRDSFKNIESGSVYVFELQGSTWIQTAKLAPLDAADWEIFCGFGVSLDVSGDTLLIGAPFMDNGLGTDRGCAFVFERSGGTWLQTQKLLPADAGNMNYFGGAVAISGESLLIGAQGHKHMPSLDGGVYAFELSGGVWTQAQELFPSDPFNPLGFGSMLDIDGDLCVVGAGVDKDLGSSSGSAYAYRRGTAGWSQMGKLLAPDGQAGDILGNSARIVGSTVSLAAVLDDDGCNDQWNCNVGSAYVFELAPETTQYFPCGIGGPCGNHDDHGGCSNSSGQGGVLAAGGSTSTTSDSLRLEARWLPANVLGILFMGGATNYLPFGDGRLSLGPGSTGVFRFLPPKSSGLEGTLIWDGGLAAYSQTLAPAGHIDPGETWYFQAWYRDPTGPCGSGFNVSNGLRVDFTP